MIIQVSGLHYEAPAGVQIGDRVRLPAPDGEVSAGRVSAFGRDGYDGPVKHVLGVIRTCEYSCNEKTVEIPDIGAGWVRS